MTIAIDIRSGAVVGQVTAGEVRGTPSAHDGTRLLRILTRDGYQYVSAASVRLEKVQ